MINLTNPAGRLHALLSQYRETADEQRTIMQTWMIVLDTDDEPYALRLLCDVASLISQIEKAVMVSGDDAQIGAFNHYASQWASPLIFPQANGNQTPSPGETLINIDALVALRSMSSYLDIAIPQGGVPDPKAVTDLRHQINAAIISLREAVELPGDFRKDLLRHLYTVLWALEHLEIHGPEGVTDAAECLLGWSVTRSQEKSPSAGKILKRVIEIAGAVWAAFKAGPTAHNAIESWIALAKMLPSSDKDDRHEK
jgi:hypothetical protein